jgi:hypothetical protein
MPLILNGRNRFAFQFGRASGPRSTSDIVDQLQSQLAAERAQHASNMSGLQKEIVSLPRQLAEVRPEIARRDQKAAFARLEDPSAIRHQASSK